VSPPVTLEAMAFAAARRTTDRSALARFIALEEGVGTGTAAMATARARFNATTPLCDPCVASLARAALHAALGPPVSMVTWTTWPHVKHTWGGLGVAGSWHQFGCWHAQLAAQVIPKGEGLAYAPVTNMDGRRCNASTVAMHMLLLDADGAGDWFQMWNEVTALNLAALLHRTASHTPALPKWRVAIPLSSPVQTSTPRTVLAWRGMYADARTVFGSLAGLRGPGFDPSTDGPHHPWFPGSRRTPDAGAPEVVLRDGATLDLHALVARLPVAPPRLMQASQGRTSVTAPLLALAFKAAGLLGRELGQGRTAVICPWNHHHTNPLPVGAAPTSASVVFAGNSEANIGSFHCMHASCGSKTPQEVLAELPAGAVEEARAAHRAQQDSAGMRAPRLARLDNALPRLPGDLS